MISSYLYFSFICYGGNFKDIQFGTNYNAKGKDNEVSLIIERDRIRQKWMVVVEVGGGGGVNHSPLSNISQCTLFTPKSLHHHRVKFLLG